MLSAHGPAGIPTSFEFWYDCKCLLSAKWRPEIFQDSAVVQDSDGEGKIVYLFLPLYKVRRNFAVMLRGSFSLLQF